MSVLRTIKRRKANWIVHISRGNYLLKHVTEGKIEEKIEVMGRRGRRCKQLLDDLKRKHMCWKLEKTLYCTVWRTRFGRGYGPAVREIK